MAGGENNLPPGTADSEDRQGDIFELGQGDEKVGIHGQRGARKCVHSRIAECWLDWHVPEIILGKGLLVP